MMTASAIVNYAPDPTKHRFLPEIYRHDWDWVQLFSEPGAGSDLAGLATRVERDGDEWVVSGHKVWSSRAMIARWGLLVARTDPDVPKHNGLTMFLIDMHQDRIEPRPLRNIVGTAEFAEVFFTGARIPDGRLSRGRVRHGALHAHGSPLQLPRGGVEHDHGRHVGDPAQQHRRARARLAR
jgi:alkylation response protein AidB-like acyl-CoA dehydrogenase